MISDSVNLCKFLYPCAHSPAGNNFYWRNILISDIFIGTAGTFPHDLLKSKEAVAIRLQLSPENKKLNTVIKISHTFFSFYKKMYQQKNLFFIHFPFERHLMYEQKLVLPIHFPCFMHFMYEHQVAATHTFFRILTTYVCFL